jgi:hypothetical protein
MYINAMMEEGARGKTKGSRWAPDLLEDLRGKGAENGREGVAHGPDVCVGVCGEEEAGVQEQAGGFLGSAPRSVSGGFDMAEDKLKGFLRLRAAPMPHEAKYEPGAHIAGQVGGSGTPFDLRAKRSSLA